MTKIHVFTINIYTQACSQDFSLGGGGGGSIPQEPGPQINNVQMIGYASSEDTLMVGVPFVSAEGASL